MPIMFQRSGSSMVRIALVGLALALVAISSFAQTTIEFNSMDRKQGFPALMQGRGEYTDKINGVFTRSAGVTGTVPVMVIMHSSAGASPESTGRWSTFFLQNGFATFVVDSFTSRGIKSTATDQGQLSWAATAVDALAALKTVAALPNVDPTKIGIIGFSRGGNGSLYSSFTSVEDAFLGKDSTLRYAFHIAFYPGINIVGNTDNTPILYIQGDRDDYYTTPKVDYFVDTLKSHHANLTYVVYHGATHGFDVDHPKSVYAPRVQQFHDCKSTITDVDTLTYSIDGVKVTSKEYGEYAATCMGRGITVTPDPKATSDARAKSLAFAKKNFAM